MLATKEQTCLESIKLSDFPWGDLCWGINCDEFAWKEPQSNFLDSSVVPFIKLMMSVKYPTKALSGQGCTWSGYTSMLPRTLLFKFSSLRTPMRNRNWKLYGEEYINPSDILARPEWDERPSNYRIMHGINAARDASTRFWVLLIEETARPAAVSLIAL